MQVQPHNTRRRAVSGILAGLIFFAMIFTAGLSFILFTFTSFNNYDKGQATALQAAQAKGAENLLLRSCDGSKNKLPPAAPYNSTIGYPCSGSDVNVWIQNNGGVAVTLQGKWILDSTINTIVLGFAPATISPTITISPGAAIIVDTLFAVPGGTHLYAISLISSTGNQFTAAYPPPPLNININAGASLTTTLSQGVISPGGSASDTATLNGVPSSAGGKIDFFYSNVCKSTPIQVGGDITVSGSGNYGPSVPVTFATAGTYYWYATYTDTMSNTITSPCEPLLVGTPTVSLATSLSPSQVTSFPVTVTDTATVIGISDATNYKVDYFYFNDGACSTPPGGTATGSVTIVSGTVAPPSTPHTFSSSGNYSFNAKLYDPSSNFVTASSCEPLAFGRQPLAITTSLSPPVLATTPTSVTDTASISGISNAAGYKVGYFYFGVNGTSVPSCTGTPNRAGGNVTISSGNVAPSSKSIVYTILATYSWQARLYLGNNLVATSSCEQLVTLTSVKSSFGLGFISLDFNSYKAIYTTANCAPGSSGCTALAIKGGFVAGAPLAYTLPSAQVQQQYVFFSVNVTNTDPSGRNIVLDAQSVLDFLQVPPGGTGGGTFSTFPWFLGNVSASGNIATSFPAGGIKIPNQNTVPKGITLYFSVVPYVSANPWSKWPPASIEGVFMYLHGVMGTGCSTLSCAGATPIGQNEPLVVTSFTNALVTLSPTSGKLGTIVTVSGTGFTPSSALTFTYDGKVLTTSPASVTSTAGGAIPGGVTFEVPTSSGGIHTILVTDASGVLSLAFFTVSPAPTLTLGPTTGPHGSNTVTTLSGANYANSHLYSYCLSTSISIACVGGVFSFTSTAGGAIPAATTLTVNQPSAGTYYVIVYGPNNNVIAASAAFTET